MKNYKKDLRSILLLVSVLTQEKYRYCTCTEHESVVIKFNEALAENRIIKSERTKSNYEFWINCVKNELWYLTRHRDINKEMQRVEVNG